MSINDLPLMQCNVCKVLLSALLLFRNKEIVLYGFAGKTVVNVCTHMRFKIGQK